MVPLQNAQQSMEMGREASYAAHFQHLLEEMCSWEKGLLLWAMTLFPKHSIHSIFMWKKIPFCWDVI